LLIAANRVGSHCAQCLRAVSPYWFTVGGSLLIAESRQHVLHDPGRGCPVPFPHRTGAARPALRRGWAGLLADEGILEQLLVGDPPVFREQRLAYVVRAAARHRPGSIPAPGVSACGVLSMAGCCGQAGPGCHGWRASRRI
jgi:hypothetical protein